MQIPIQLPHSLLSIVSFLEFNGILNGLILLLISFLLIIFSRYFKWIFLVIFFIIEFYLYITLKAYFNDTRLILIGILSSMIFFPFLYLSLKNGYSITIINIIVIGYVLIFHNILFSSWIIFSILFIFLFIFSLITFYLFLKIKRRLFAPRGENV